MLPQRTGGVLNECDTRRSRGPLVQGVKAIVADTLPAEREVSLIHL